MKRTSKVHHFNRPWIGHRIAPDFGEILAARRRDLKLTQVKLGASLKVSAAVVGGFERGQRVYFPRPELFWPLARALRLSPHEMFDAAYGQSRAAIFREVNGKGGEAAILKAAKGAK